MNVTRWVRCCFFLGLMIFIAGAGLEAQTTDQGSFLRAVETSNHVMHHLPRPTDLGDFGSLEEWIKANYNVALMADTLKHDIRAGRDTISFFTMSEDGITDHHVLADSGDEFVLQTTSRINPPRSGEVNPIDESVAEREISSRANSFTATTASSSCATGSTWNSTLIPPGYEPNAFNCTSYVRCLVPSYPRPAYYYTEKLKTINVWYPSTGWVAIMNYSQPYGHVGVIDGMWWVWQGSIANLFLSLNEANFTYHKVTYNRSGQPGTLHIVGYFRP